MVAFPWSTLPSSVWLADHGSPTRAQFGHHCSNPFPCLTPSATQVQLFAGACGDLDKGLKIVVKAGLKMFTVFLIK